MAKKTYDEVFDRVRGCTELATFANSLREILSVTQSPSASAKNLAAVISKDPALAAKILRTVNSCFYGFTRTIETLDDAVSLLGFSEIERLSLAVSVINQFSSKRKLAKALKQLWRHSLVCGVAAETLVELYKIRNVAANDIYMGALLHDIGKAVILQVMPEALPEILSVMQLKKATPYEAEHEVLGGATHCEIGAWASAEWGLPPAIIESMQMHHTPEQVPGDTTLLKIIYMADAVCYYFAVPAVQLPNNAPQPGPAGCMALKDNAAFVNRFRERWEAKRNAIEAITG